MHSTSHTCTGSKRPVGGRGFLPNNCQIRVYGQCSIETIHERRKRLAFIQIGKQNVKIIEK